MNHTAEEEVRPLPQSGEVRQKQPLTLAAVFASMLLYPVLVLYHPGPGGNVGIVLLAGVAAYPLAIFLFFGIATFAYRGFYGMLIAGLAGALATGFVMAGIEEVVQVVLACGAIFVTSYVTGRSIRNNRSGLWVYIVGLIILGIFTIAEFGPKWPEMMKAISEMGNSFVKDIDATMLTGDKSPEAAQSYSQAFQDAMNFLVHLFPASNILSVFAQFSIGFMIFLFTTVRRTTGRLLISPFIFWKIPFMVMPLVVVALAVRLIGGETLVLMADNALAVLAVFYAVAGLAIVEFSFMRLQFPVFMKVIFYILLFFTQFIGLMLMVGMGFIDSFADWRKLTPPKITVDN